MSRVRNFFFRCLSIKISKDALFNLKFEAIEIRDEICQNKNVIHRNSIHTPLEI